MLSRLVFLLALLAGMVITSLGQTTCDLPGKLCTPGSGNLWKVLGRAYIVRFTTDDFTGEKNRLIPLVIFGSERLAVATIAVVNTNGNNFDGEQKGFPPRVTIIPTTSKEPGTKVQNGRTGLEPSTSIGIGCIQPDGGQQPVLLKFNYGTYNKGDAIYVQTAQNSPGCKVGLHVYAVTVPAIP